MPVQNPLKRLKGMMALLAFAALLSNADSSFGAYKSRPWSPRARDSYAARLSSEGITIAVEPLFRDDLAAAVFDYKDMVTRGVLPVAVVVFNENDFAVRLPAGPIQLISENELFQTLVPGEAAARLFQKGGRSIWLPNPIPRRSTGERVDPGALGDFEHKFLGDRTIAGHGKGGGFLFFSMPARNLADFLSTARLYLPEIYRQDNGARMIFFEIDLKSAVEQAPPPRK